MIIRVSCTMVAFSTLALFAALPSNAYAEDNENQTVWNIFHGAPKFKSDNGNYWKIRGRILWDIADITETPINGLSRNINADEFRAARIGIEGQFDVFKYKAELDFAGNKTSYKDINVTWKGPLAITVGQMKAGGSLEEITSSRHIAFMERGMATDAFGFDRRLGVNIAKSGKNYGVNAGIFGNSINGKKDDKPSNTVWAARGYFTPVQEKGNIVHLGASVRHTNNATGAPKHSARWGLHQATEKVKPVIGSDAFLFGFEAATVQGAFHAHAEYLTEDGDLGSAKGGFIQAGYFLTGESRKYKGGKFDRTSPLKPLSQGG
ncbi:MAG TPA: hypothetical protein ENJ46_06565, partial [Hellea balneolensis]|nr:hypothetical protein [Hellea balneolensis]